MDCFIWGWVGSVLIFPTQFAQQAFWKWAVFHITAMLFILATLQGERQSALLFCAEQPGTVSVCGLVLNINYTNGKAEPF